MANHHAHTPPAGDADQRIDSGTDADAVAAGIDVAAARARLADSGPLVQCITNTVVQQVMANALLATGAAPAMLDHEADAGEFAALSSAVLINLGTASSHHFLAADAAIGAANEAGIPWVLDPVSVGGVAYRTTRIRRAAAEAPTAIRGNASEIAALAGMGLGGRGVDSTDAVDDVIGAAIALSAATSAVVAVSGESDAAVHADADSGNARVVRVDGGHALMTRVIGTGCSLGAVTAAYLGADAARAATFDAVVAAHAHFAAAGALAAEQAQAPGSYAVAFIDALYTVTDAQLRDVVLREEVVSFDEAGSDAETATSDATSGATSGATS